MQNVLSVAVVGVASRTSVMATALLELIRRGRDLTGTLPFAGPDSLPGYTDISIAGWDYRSNDLAEASARHHLFDTETENAVRPRLAAIRAWPAIGDPSFCGGGSSFLRQSTLTLREAVDVLRDDLDRLHQVSGPDVVMLDCQALASPRAEEAISDAGALEEALDGNDGQIEDSALYAYAAIMSGVPYARMRPGPLPHAKALGELAEREGVPFLPRTDLEPDDPVAAAALAIETARCLAPRTRSSKERVDIPLSFESAAGPVRPLPFGLAARN